MSVQRKLQPSASCTSVLLAPEIQELVRLMQSPDVHGVVTREFSRLMRPENFSDYALLQAFANSKTVLYLPEGPIDLSNKSGRLMGTSPPGIDECKCMVRRPDCKKSFVDGLQSA